MTELEAVRQMVRLSGRGDVTKLDGVDATSLSGRAQRTLRDASYMLQSRGWHFNKLQEITLEPDAEKFIEIPSHYLLIDSDGNDSDINVTERGSRLYNLDDNTFEFDNSITVNAIILSEWDCLPFWFRNYAMFTAARDMIMNQTSELSRADAIRYDHITMRLRQAKGIAEQSNYRSSDSPVHDDGRRLTHQGPRFGDARYARRG